MNRLKRNSDIDQRVQCPSVDGVSGALRASCVKCIILQVLVLVGKP